MSHRTSEPAEQVALVELTLDDADALHLLGPAAGQAVVPADRAWGRARFYAAAALAEALLTPGAWLRTVRSGCTPVGLIWLQPAPGGEPWTICRLLVGAEYQGRGLGTAAVRQAVDHAVKQGARSISLACLSAPAGPEDFFRKLGFVPCGTMRGAELVLELHCPDRDPRALSLQPVTPENAGYLCALEGTEHVAPAPVTIVDAQFEPGALLRAIYLGREPVGLLLLAQDPAGDEFFLWRLMVAPRYRGRGYGTWALGQLAIHVRDTMGGSSLLTSSDTGPGSPESFYDRLGFRPTGDKIGDEVVLRLDLSGRPEETWGLDP